MRKLMVSFVVALAAASIYAAMSDTVAVSVLPGSGSGNFLSIEPASVTFGIVNPSPTVYRFKSAMMTCTFFAATAPWSIEVSTANVGDRVGLVATNGSGQVVDMPMKFWQANYGGGLDPDPNVATNWSGAGPCFKWVFDDGLIPAMTLGSSASQDASPINFKFAIDAMGAYRTNYSSVVTFNLVIQ